MKKKLGFLEPIEDPCKVIMKRFKEKRTKILKQSMSKLKKIPDAEQCLRQAVLIRNTFIRAKDLSPRQFERQLLTQNIDNLDQNHADLLQDFEHHNNNQMEISNCSKTTSSPSHQDNLSQTYGSTSASSQECREVSTTTTSTAVDRCRQLVAVS